MDESTYGESSLRSLKSLINKNTKSQPLDLRVQRRVRLKKERRFEQLILLWRIASYCTISIGLGFLFVNNGQKEISQKEINIKGSSTLNANSIVAASETYFPQKLLSLDQKKLQQNLLNQLPIEAVSIRKRILPPRIDIELVERKPIALAKRKTSNGKEEGMLDEYGFWIPMRIAKQLKTPSSIIYIDGWSPRHKKWISMILQNRERLGSPLVKIIVKANGELSIQTKSHKSINLGSNPEILFAQINVLNHLDNVLPNDFRNIDSVSIDLSDPAKPELLLPKGTKSN